MFSIEEVFGSSKVDQISISVEVGIAIAVIIALVFLFFIFLSDPSKIPPRKNTYSYLLSYLSALVFCGIGITDAIFRHFAYHGDLLRVQGDHARVYWVDIKILIPIATLTAIAILLGLYFLVQRKKRNDDNDNI